MLVGTDPTTDSLLKIEAEGLQKITVANPTMFASANGCSLWESFHLTSTVTAGIISAKGRDINIIDEQSAIESFFKQMQRSILGIQAVHR